MRTREELAWCAGFFDGEGYIGFGESSGVRRRRPYHYARMIIQVNQAVDHEFGPPEVLEKLKSFTGLGRVNGPYGKVSPISGNPVKTQYMWICASFEQVQAFIAMVWEFLSEDKREQASMAFKKYYAWKAMA